MVGGDIATTSSPWAAMRAISFGGCWIVTSLYLVIDADLSAFQLVSSARRWRSVMGVLAQATSITVALTCSCAMVTSVGLVVTRPAAGRDTGVAVPGSG